MKKFFISAVLATAIVFSASAQFWVGGSVGFASERENNADGDRIWSESVFSISPEVGFSLNNRWDVGLGLGLINEGFRVGSDGDRESASFFSVAPFVQYTFLEFGRIQLLCRASVGFGMLNDDDWRETVFGINVTPFVHYVISDRFNLFAGLNFLSLNFARLSESFDGTSLGSASMFDFGADSNNLFNTGNFQIGFIFKF